jgi:AMIN domain
MKKIKSLISIIGTMVILNTGQVLAGKLTQWSYNLEQNQLEFTVADSTIPKYFILENPTRIVIDFPNTKIGNVKTKESYQGKVREIRLAQFDEETTRLVMEFLPEINLNSAQISLEKSGQNRWILHQNMKENVTVTVPPLQPRPQSSNNNSTTPTPENKSPIIKFGEPLP